ncbi:MAG: helix-turn-helix transcriptional regulator [Ruminococcaceae bacterium]|nr:helix-turn-helix transcriptional regulator [Oscillospiraceae bacterium]
MQDDYIRRKSVQKFKYATQFNEFEKSLNIQFRCAMHYKPKITNLSVEKRYFGCLLYIVKGSYTYTFKKGKITAEKDDIIYLPYGSSYKYHINSNDTETMQIEFNISNSDGEKIIINEYPILIKNNSGKIKNLFLEVINLKNNTSYTHKFKAMSNILEILSYVSETVEKSVLKTSKKRISPAVNYIENNSEKKIYTKELAFLCGLSESRFRKVFTYEMGMSPIKYKNHIRLQNAIALIKTGNISISEIAEALGFESVYAFSQFFKSQTGYSPSKYIKNKE